MTALTLLGAVFGAFGAFAEAEPVYNVLGVLLLVVCLRLFIRLAFRGKSGGKV